jgi:hypothetical protein
MDARVRPAHDGMHRFRAPQNLFFRFLLLHSEQPSGSPAFVDAFRSLAGTGFFVNLASAGRIALRRTGRWRGNEQAAAQQRADQLDFHSASSSFVFLQQTPPAMPKDTKSPAPRQQLAVAAL